MVKVMLTPIPAGLITDNGSYALKVNILVSLKPGVDRNDSEPLRLDEITYLNFAGWIRNLIDSASIKIKPDVNSLVQGKNFVACTGPHDFKRTKEQIHSYWITLFEENIYKTFQENLNDNRFERTQLQELKETNATALIALKKTLAEKTSQQKKLSKQYQAYLIRQNRLNDFTTELDADAKADKSELDSYGKDLQEQGFKDELAAFQKRGTSLKDREVRGMTACKLKLDKVDGEIDSLTVTQAQRKDLAAELQRTTSSGILNINNTDLKKISDSITNIQATINNAPEEAKRLQQAIGPNLEDRYTSNINSSRIIYYSDVAGYFFNYPSALYDLGIMHAVQMPVDAALINTLTGESGTLSLEIVGNLDTGDFVYASDPLHTKGVAYQIFPYTLQTKRTIHFMPRQKNPGLDPSQSLFTGGFLNLKSVDENKNRRFVLLQNNPQQMKFQQSDIEKGQFNDHTKGFYLIKQAAVDPNENSNKSADQPLFLEDLLIGYRIDVRRKILDAKDLRTNWKSLHQRSGGISLKGRPVAIADEGWISKDSLVQVKKKVFVSPHGATVNKQAVNIPNLELGIYDVLDDNDQPTAQTITLTDQDGDNLRRNTTANYNINKTKFLTQTSTYLDTLNDELGSWTIGIKRMACNDHGEFFYDVYVDDGKHISAASFLPTSVICYINGLSLNAPVVMSSYLKDQYTQMEKDGTAAIMNSNGLVAYMAQCKISISEMQALDRSLPALRINDIYQVRCRLVFLDGSSLPLASDTDTLDYGLQKQFLRQDNIPSPLILSPQKTYKYIGESPFKAIVCSDEEASESVRYILPPAGNWLLAEWSKVMDADNHLPSDAIIDRFAQNYTPVFDPPDKSHQADTYIQIKKNGRVPDIFDPLDSKIHYIPDPAALYFRIIPTYRNKKSLLNNFGNYKTLILPFYTNNRPDPANVIIYKLTVRAAKKTDPAGFTKGAKINNVQEIILWMHRTDDVEFLVRSMPFGDFNNTAQFQHYYASPDILSQVDFSTNKPYPVFFGDQKMTAIHANIDPVGYPWFAGDKLQDESTYVVPTRAGLLPTQLKITGNLFFPGATCDELELYGEWVDAIDDPDSDQPLRFDTVTKKLHDFFDADRAQLLTMMSPANPDLFNDSEAQNAPNKRIIYDNVSYHFDLIHDVPDGKHRIIRYWLVSRNRFLKLLTKDKKGAHTISNQEPKERSRFYPLRVPAALAPATPKVAFVLPVFRWSRLPKHDHIRSGDTIRVYFERPWFSSGVGEQVALVLLPSNAKKGDIPRLSPFCSAWGSDHVDGNVGLKRLTLANLVNAKPFDLNEDYLNINNPLFASNKSKLFDYALFDVQFNPMKKLWYSDITFQLPNFSYCPFIQLSIARYQRYAAPGMHFSDRVFTDFIQLYPERQISVKKAFDGGISMELLPSMVSRQAVNQPEWQTRQLPTKPNVVRATFFKASDVDLKATTDDGGDLFFREEKSIFSKDLILNDVTNNYSLQVPKFGTSEKVILVLREYEDFSVGEFDESKLRLVLTDTIHSDNFD